MARVDPDDPQVQERLPSPPSRRRKRSGIAVGAVLGVVGILGAPTCLAAAAFTANPCGTFGDGCADYGQISTIASVFLYGVVLSAGMAIAGFVLMAVGLVTRSRSGSEVSQPRRAGAAGER